jgi:uncharacterized membrane protein
MSELVVIAYDTEQTGRNAFNELSDMQRTGIITLTDAALAVKDQKGKVKVKQTLEKEHTGTAAAWGGFWGLLIGLLLLAPIFWGLVGALLGAAIGKVTYLGIDKEFIKQVGDSLDPGGSALFMLVIEATPDRVLEEMKKFGGEVYQTSLSNEDEEKLKQALEQPQVKDAADEMMDLE